MFVLRNSFAIFDGISQKREKWLKKKGINTWEDLKINGKNFFNEKEFKKLRKRIRDAEKHLENKNIEYFIKLINRENYYLLYNDFKDLVCFLDIETTGLGDESDLTILGISDFQGRYRVFVKGINFNERAILHYLKNFRIVITFYGSRFDIPFIRKRYKRIGKRLEKMPHIDLCFLGHRVGFKGGLKFIEKQVGIAREEDIEGLSGFDAIKLWNKYLEGDMKSLITLIRYNRSDVINLIKLIDIEIKMMEDFYS